MEETYGLAPPYGILVYGDGREVKVAWDQAAKSHLGGILEGRKARAGPTEA